MGETNLLKKEDLEKQGWQRQATYDESRISEITEVYEEMGLEVHLQSFNPKENDEAGCIECLKNQPERYKTVYTRKKDQS